jgi:hypothetical protein
MNRRNAVSGLFYETPERSTLQLTFFILHMVAHEKEQVDRHADDEYDSEQAQQTDIGFEQNFPRHVVLLYCLPHRQ